MSSRKLPASIIRRLNKEIVRNNLRATLIDNEYMFVPITLPRPLQKRAERAGLDPALVLTLHGYPWKVPRVRYFSHEAAAIYGCGSNELTDEIHKMTGGVMCLCCSSILCPNNWRATHTIKEIVDEFIKIVSLKVRAQERIFCNRIQETLFNCVKDKDGNVSLNCLPLTSYRISDFL